MVALGIGAVVGVGAVAASNNEKGKALAGAASKEQRALGSLQPLDANELNRISSAQTRQQFADSIKSQQELDPTFAALREKGGQAVLLGLTQDASGNTYADKSAKEISASLASGKGSHDEIIGQLLDRVKADLNAGATLPPEFQAELVKSGLESAGQQGLNIDGRGASGVQTRELLGSAGLALKQQREANARQNLGAADTLRQSRQSALERLAELDSNMRGAKITRGAAGIGIGNQNMPTVGMSGTDAANIAIKNNAFENSRKLGIAASMVNNQLGQGALTASTISSAGSAISGLAGSASAAGGGAKNGSWINGILNK